MHNHILRCTSFFVLTGDLGQVYINKHIIGVNAHAYFKL